MTTTRTTSRTAKPTTTVTRREPATTYTCTEVAELTGFSAFTLRVWEKRYGWPKPARDPHNGYRTYTHKDVENLSKIAEFIRRDWSIGSLIKSGKPSFPVWNKKPSKVPSRSRVRSVVVEKPAEKEPEVLGGPNPDPLATRVDECERCGAEGGEPKLCDACGYAKFCSKCDTGGKCPSCGEPLP